VSSTCTRQEARVALLEKKPSVRQRAACRPSSVAASRAIEQAPAGIASRRCNKLQGSFRAQGNASASRHRTNPAAPWNRDTGGLIEHQELIVMVDEGLADALHSRRRPLPAWLAAASTRTTGGGEAV